MKPIRQGDVLLVPCTEVPTGKVEKHATLTVQLGEQTGHHHTFYPVEKSFFVANEELPFEAVNNGWIEEFVQNDKRFVKLDTEWLLRHQEHSELKVPAGTYEIRIEREYDPFEENMKKVVD